VTALVQVPATVAETLDAAADLILRRDWAQGMADTAAADADNDLPVCAGLAIQFAQGVTRRERAQATTSDLAMSAAGKAAHYFNAWLGVEDFGVIGWNDAEGRTKAEVVTALREAAAAARAGR